MDTRPFITMAPLHPTGTTVPHSVFMVRAVIFPTATRSRRNPPLLATQPIVVARPWLPAFLLCYRLVTKSTARSCPRVSSLLDHDLAVHNHILDSIRILKRFLVGCFILYTFRIENRQVSHKSFLQ